MLHQSAAAASAAAHAVSALSGERQRLHLNDQRPCGISSNRPSDRCLDGMKVQ
jgi:hypothetical protein